MTLQDYNVNELLNRLHEDWRELITKRAVAEGVEREQYDKVYGRLIGYMAEIERIRSEQSMALPGLIATCGTILDEFLRKEVQR